MPIINGIEYIDNPEANSELISGIINLPISGKRKLNPTDTKKKRITRKDVAKMARDMANSEDAQQYLSGQVSLGGNKSRQKLFDRAFKSEIERQKQEELLRQIGLGGEEVVVAPGIKGDDAYKIATSFRNRPLTGHIGAGLDQNLGDKDLLRIAPAAIGPVLGMANPVTGAITEGMLSEAANLGSKASPYVDKMVTPVKNWFLKDGLKWYDPRHVVKTIFNPKSAYTAGGQAAATALDLGGAYSSYNDLINNVWTPLKQQYQNQGYIDVTTLPSHVGRAGMDFLGMTPILSYADDVMKIPGAVYSGLSRLADETVQSYNALRSGVEPVYGIRAEILGNSNSYPDLITDWQNQQAVNRFNEQLRSINIDDISETHLPEPPSEVTIDLNTSSAPRELPVWSGTDAASLPRSLTRRLQSLGIGRYDVQNLLDRGYTPEQLEYLSYIDVNTPGLTYNPRANVLARRLSESGVLPASQSRMEYLQDLQSQGAVLVQNQFGRPMSYAEFISDPSTSHLDPFDYELPYEGLIDYYQSELPISRRPVVSGQSSSILGQSAPMLHPVYHSSDYSDVIEKLNQSLVTFDDATFKQVSPRIQQIIETGYSSGMTPQEMEQQLSALFAEHNRPFFKFPNIIGKTHVSASLPSINPHVIFKPEYTHNWNVPWRNTPYTIKDVPFRVDPSETRLGYNHWSMFNSDTSDIMKAKAEVFENTPHGGITYEWNKSLQSSPVAHQDYARKAENGQGVIVFMPNSNGRYNMSETNGFEGSIIRPNRINGRLNAPTLTKLFRNNIGQWKNIFKNVDPRAYEQYGGVAPDITVRVDGTDFVLKPQFSEGRFIGFDGEDAALRATEALDQRVIAARQPRLDAARQRYENAIEQVKSQMGIELPEGVTWTMTPAGPRLQYIQTTGNFKGQLGSDSVSNFIQNYNLQNDPKWAQFQRELDAIESQYISDQMFDTYVGDFSIRQPVVGFRKFNRGGIIKNLNKNTSKLLSI